MALLAACAPADAPVASPTPSPTVSRDQRSDLELVRAAYRATRAAKTGTFLAKAVMGIGPGNLTVRREGSYDLGRSLMSLTQTFTAYPPELMEEIAEGNDNPELTVHTVATATHGYLQMPGWPPPVNERWLRFDPDDVEGAGGYAPDLDAAIFPPAVDLLRHAEASGQDGTGRSELPPVLHVVVPAGVALLALPSAAAAKLIDAGVDPESFDGEVEVEVEVIKGVVRAVRYDAIDVYRAALAEAGQPGRITREITEMSAEVTLDSAGRPVRITVPTAAQVISEDEFERAGRRQR